MLFVIMTIKKHCPKCKADREVNILDVLTKGKKRVVCAHCNTVLVTEGELDTYYWRYYSDC